MTEIQLPLSAGGYKQKTRHEFASAQEMREHYRRVTARMSQKPHSMHTEPIPSPPLPAPMPDLAPPIQIEPSVEFTLPILTPGKIPKVSDVIRVSCAYFKLTHDQLLARRRIQPLVFARHIAAYVARSLTTSSYPLIGRSLGGLDHTSVIHGVRNIERLLTQRDDRATHAVKTITDHLRKFSPSYAHYSQADNKVDTTKIVA